jgi:hypothetical protein
MNEGYVRALYSLWRGHCELAHYLDAESVIYSFTFPVIFSLLNLRPWSGPPSSTSDQPFDLKICIQSWLRLWCWRKRWLLRSLASCSFLLFAFSVKWVSSKASVASSFSDHIEKSKSCHMWWHFLWFIPWCQNKRYPCSLFVPEWGFQDHFCTDLPHVKPVMQDYPYRLFFYINHHSNCSNAETLIFLNSFTEFVNIFVGFLFWRTSQRSSSSASVLLDFHPSCKFGKRTPYGHSQTKLRDKPNDVKRWFWPCSVREASKPVTIYPLLTPTSFSVRARAVLLCNSHTSYYVEYENYLCLAVHINILSLCYEIIVFNSEESKIWLELVSVGVLGIAFTFTFSSLFLILLFTRFWCLILIH